MKTFNVAQYIREQFARLRDVDASHVHVYNDVDNECIHVVVKRDAHHCTTYMMQITSDDDEYIFFNVVDQLYDRNDNDDVVKFDIIDDIVDADELLFD
jgi:hypothetical protein